MSGVEDKGGNDGINERDTEFPQARIAREIRSGSLSKYSKCIVRID